MYGLKKKKTKLGILGHAKRILKISKHLLIYLFLISLFSPILGIKTDFSTIREGKIRWILPNSFAQGNTKKVKILLSYDLSYEQNLTSNEREQSSKFELIDTVNTSQVMAYELVGTRNNGGDQFLIEPSGFQEQVIDTSKNGQNYWEWSITPLKAGNATLTLNQKLRISTSEGLIDKIQPSISKSVKIENRIIYQAKEFLPILHSLIWVIIAFIYSIGVFTYYYNSRNSVKEKRDIKNRLMKEMKGVNYESILKLKILIEELVSKNKVDDSIKKLLEFTDQNDAKEVKTLAVRISSNFENNEKEYHLNTISNSDYNINRARLVNGLLNLVSDLKKYAKK